MGAAGATLQGSWSGATGQIYGSGFLFGADQSNLAELDELKCDGSNNASGSFSVSVGGLASSTTYYYQAYVLELNESTNNYDYCYGSIRSFTTSSSGPLASNGYLGCYEIPAMNWTGTGSTGNETYGSTKWYSYETTTSTQKAATHTYSYNGKVYRNYTTYMDKTKLAPLWCAFVMHNGAYPRNNVGRTGDWHNDPAFTADWQQESAPGSYSRGHFVASNYRQANTDANKQTFYCTNQALQWQNSFNSGVWSSLEDDVISHSPTGRDTLYVVVGTLYKNSTTAGGVPVPSHFYKLLMKCSFNSSGAMTAASGCAYLFTNEAHSGASYTSFITTIDAVEAETGINYFANVPDIYENAAEASNSPLW